MESDQIAIHFYKVERIIRMKKEEQQWDLIEKAKIILMNWVQNYNVHLFTVHLVPMLDFSLEVYIFYENDFDITQN